jgi:replicative DNA helicase
MADYGSAPSERIPPNNTDAERAVLGSCLLERDAFLIAAESVRPGDFYDPRHSMIFDAMMELAKRDRAIDQLTLSEELSARTQLERVGGVAYITLMADAVATTANIEHYCAIVRDKSIHRELINAGSDIARVGFDEGMDSDDALSSAERRIFGIEHSAASNIRDMASLVQEAVSQIERNISQGGVGVGVSSGFADFDNMTGGFQPDSLNIIAARPSMGKTAFALNVAENAAFRSNTPVLVFSLEMSAAQIAGRLLASVAEVNLRELQRAGAKDGGVSRSVWERLTDAAARLSRSTIFVDDTSPITPMELRSRCRRFVTRHKGAQCLIIIDYIQIMASSRRSDNRQQEVSDISRALKGIAREFSVPVIALSQLSREVEKRGNDKRPVLSDLRDSGAIEQDADIVAFLYRQAYYQQDSETSDQSAELSIAKHRNGPTGKIDLMFLREYSKFTSLSKLPYN